MELTSLRLFHLVAAAAIVLPLMLLVPWRLMWRTLSNSTLPATAAQGTTEETVLVETASDGHGTVLLSQGVAVAQEPRRSGVARVVLGVGRRLVRWLVILLAQVLAIGAVFLWANNTYGLYNTWSDIFQDNKVVDNAPIEAVHPLGTVPVIRMKISPNNPHPGGQMVTLQVGGGADPQYSTATVWLPPQYFEKSHRTTRFPVMVAMAAMHQTGAEFAAQLKASQTNMKLIESGRATPYIAVYVGSRIVSGVDSECVDLPNGVRGQSWYSQNLVKAVASHYRTAAPGKGWFATGYSTGGQCAALLAAKYPKIYNGAMSMAGYMEPVFDDPSVIAGHPELRTENSLIDMVKANKIKQLRLLTVVSVKDSQSWGNGAKTPMDHGQRMGDIQIFEPLARDIPGVAFTLLPYGGHSDSTYMPQWSDALEWLGTQGL